MPPPKDPPGALRFACQSGCTNCCDQRGFVYLTAQDLRNAAEFLGLSKRAFTKRYVYRTRHLRRLRKPPDRQCPFLEPGKGCAIHPVKPVQCRLFPFWPELVENRAAWFVAGLDCPGIGKGELIQIGQAMETASEMKTAYPTMY
ncbi:MAG: YkgJ family cysteine cluster protein [Bryobacteraceae bacterium]